MLVVGAGVNGASAAQHLTAAGYSVLLIDKGDFGAGSSSRSSRLLHCGLRYLAPGTSIWDFVRSPRRLAIALRMARQAMASRHQFVSTTPERSRAFTFGFPIYRDGPYAGWQVRLAFNLLRLLGAGGTPLDYAYLPAAEVARTPLWSGLRDPEKLSAVASFREYRFDWPERICLDAALSAQDQGAAIRNYTALAGMERQGDETWLCRLTDAVVGDSIEVRAKAVINAAGIWIDRVNAAGSRDCRRYITGTKGSHIMVRLPPDCADRGIATLNRLNLPFYCVPWRGLHYFGPTETLYDGDVDDIRPTEEEIEFLLAEANHLMPSLGLGRADVLFSWAGVRPLGHDPAFPEGKRSREIHELTGQGLPGVLAITAGPIMTHRSAGDALCRAVAGRVAPSRSQQPLSFAARRFPDRQNSPPLLDHWTEAKLADVAYAAKHEQPVTLVDLLFRRLGVGWTQSMGLEAAEAAARAAAAELGWDEARLAAEVTAYKDHLRREHHLVQPNS